MQLKDIAQALGARLDGDGALDIKRLVHPDQAEGPGDLALAMSSDAASALARSKASAAVVSDGFDPESAPLRGVIAVDRPRLALAVLTGLFDPGPAHGPGVHPTAVVAADAVLAAGVNVGPYAVIGARTRIGARTLVLPHVTIGADVTVGAQVLLHAGVRIGDRARIGDRVIVHANAVIGADGFSFAPDLASPTEFVKGVVVTRVHSLGTVEIADDVEIGACTTIDRSTIEVTKIGQGTKIDNHVHIGHNVVIGESCMICGMVGISGSVRLGDRVRLGGGVGVGDHVSIGDEAVVAAGSGVGSNVPPRTFVSGYPAMPHQRTMEYLYYATRSKRLHGKVDDMNARLEAVERLVKK